VFLIAALYTLGGVRTTVIPRSDEMIVVHVAVRAQARTAAAFARSLQEIVAAARQAPGCLRNEWYHVPDAPRQYVIYGEFDTREHFEAYQRSELVKRIGDELIPLLEAPPQFRHYEATVLDASESL
jgi:quinol monooxygenase YgiN